MLGHRVHDRPDVGGGGRDHAQDLADRGLLLERGLESHCALFHLPLEPRVGLAELRGHPVELAGQRLEFVAGLHVDLVVEPALADQLRAFLQRADRPRHAARQEQRGERGDHEAAEQQEADARDRRVQPREHLGGRLLDEDGPAQRLDGGVRGQHFGAARAARRDDAVLGAAPGERRLDVREAREVGLAQHEPDVGVRDQVARGVDHVGLALLADLDARDHVPHELEVHVGDRDRPRVAAGAHRDLHVRLGLLAERDAPVPGPGGRRLEERRIAAAIPQAVASGVHCQARHLRLLAAVRADPRDVGDVGHLLQELQELEAPLLRALRAQLRQRSALELRLHLQDVLLDAAGGRHRLLALQRVEDVERLAVREEEGDRGRDQQRRGDEREDQHEVPAEQPVAGRTASRGSRRHVDIAGEIGERAGSVHHTARAWREVAARGVTGSPRRRARAPRPES